MSSSYDLVVFDWEGTLGDTLGQILFGLKQAAAEMGLGEIQDEEARQYLAFGISKTIKKIFPHATEAQEKILLEHVQASLNAGVVEAWLLPGAKDLVGLLHQSGFFLAVASNKGSQSLAKALDSSGLSAYIKVTRSAGQVPAKPCPQMLHEIMDHFQVHPNATLMIGDSISDMEMAKLAGVDSVGVNFYHQDDKDLWQAGAKAVFDDYAQLALFLNLPFSSI